MSEIIIRKARREDCEIIATLIRVHCDNIRELATYEKVPDGPQIDYKTLERDGFDGKSLYVCNVATYNDQIIGYTFSYYSYSSWFGKSMHLEDLFVVPNFRGKNVGSKLLQALAQEAIANGVNKLDLLVVEWNPAKKFYKKLGAFDVTAKELWLVFRFPNESLKKLASACK